MKRLVVLSVVLLAVVVACGTGGTPKSISGTVSIATGTFVADAPYVPNQVLVKFRSGIAAQIANLRLENATLQNLRGLGLENVRLMSSSNNDINAVLAGLSRRSDVVWAHPNYIQKALAVPNDPNFNLQWHYPKIKLEQAWDIENGTSNPVTVAVIDTGILSNHPDFATKLLPGYDFISDSRSARDGNGRDNNPEDVGDLFEPSQSSYHGSHVAGTVAAATNNSIGVAGVSWGAKIVPVRVLGQGGGTIADIVDGMLWAAGIAVSGVPNNANPAQILNMSLGGNGSCAQSPAYQDAINRINQAGKIIVVAAGNENQDASNARPASCSGVITVGATEFQNARAPYSNFGTRIDVMAPGGDVSKDLNNDQFIDGVLSPLKNDSNGEFNYVFENGTSMAAPHVAGVIALLKSKDPTLSLARALDVLTRTATPLNATACTGSGSAKLPEDCGAGLIDAAAALQALGNTNTPPPDFALSFNPSSLRLAPGSSGNSVLSYSTSGGFNAVPDFSLQAPSGITVTSGNATGNDVPVQISVASGVASGSYRVVFTGTSGALSRKAELNINVQSAALPSVNLAGTFVIACFVASQTDICNTQKSKLVQLTASGSSLAYTISDLSDGVYLMVAWKDTDNNQDINNGDLIGVYDNDLVTPPASNIGFAVSSVQGIGVLSQKGIAVAALSRTIQALQR
jgi:serine protease